MFRIVFTTDKVKNSVFTGNLSQALRLFTVVRKQTPVIFGVTVGDITIDTKAFIGSLKKLERNNKLKRQRNEKGKINK